MGFLLSLGICWIKEDTEDKWFDAKRNRRCYRSKSAWSYSMDKIKKYKSSDIVSKTNSILDIAYRNIAAELVSRSYLEKAQSIGFISTSNTRDKSVNIAEYSGIFAKLNKSVVLVDTDFSNPSKLLKHLKLYV